MLADFENFVEKKKNKTAGTPILVDLTGCIPDDCSELINRSKVQQSIALDRHQQVLARPEGRMRSLAHSVVAQPSRVFMCVRLRKGMQAKQQQQQQLRQNN